MYHEKLIKLRKDRGLIQNDIAKILGISKSTYSNYETEYEIIPFKHLVKLVNIIMYH